MAAGIRTRLSRWGVTISNVFVRARILLNYYGRNTNTLRAITPLSVELRTSRPAHLERLEELYPAVTTRTSVLVKEHSLRPLNVFVYS